MFQNPMMLMMVIGGGMMLAMPYMIVCGLSSFFFCTDCWSLHRKIWIQRLWKVSAIDMQK
jgi:hypothetical protein